MYTGYEESRNKKRLVKLGPHTFFGEQTFSSPEEDSPVKASVRATEHCHIKVSPP